ncbi:nucleoside triphosphate pyrophosphohydrolase [Olsenella sp. An290]|uniref:nucleoside triphosphate pyrophosphohydrolase n=1 Tax=Olsenella sp. An290 TaxID=1965625 RepID=UPI000B39AFBD|nr:nucleoside triphosphate pyrophosphohydrolase [Olsenella sp. An290]OUO35752.1 nucleoside triphosphate pyrophosphohydrolase [Olsenella sp. An290]
MSHAADRADAETAARPGAPAAHPEFDRLVRTMWRLRQPDGCPWDREQTHRSITKHMVEEAYEAVEAIEEGSAAHLAEELGDVLEQVVLHAQIAADEGAFTIDDVVAGLNEKLVRRHPHVFGELAAASDGDEVQDIWDEVKAAERAAAGEEGGAREPGLLDSVPLSLPALMQCQKLSRRAAKAGFEWPDLAGVWEKVAEERAEFEREAPGSRERTEEFGDLLFSLVQVARWEGIDAEEALAASNRKFRHRWARMEAFAHEEGVSLDGLDPARWDELWERAKAEESA